MADDNDREGFSFDPIGFGLKTVSFIESQKARTQSRKAEKRTAGFLQDRLAGLVGAEAPIQEFFETETELLGQQQSNVLSGLRFGSEQSLLQAFEKGRSSFGQSGFAGQGAQERVLGRNVSDILGQTEFRTQDVISGFEERGLGARRDFEDRLSDLQSERDQLRIQLSQLGFGETREEQESIDQARREQFGGFRTRVNKKTGEVQRQTADGNWVTVS